MPSHQLALPYNGTRHCSGNDGAPPKTQPKYSTSDTISSVGTAQLFYSALLWQRQGVIENLSTSKQQVIVIQTRPYQNQS
jgi:hypothetical protein